MSVDTGTHTTQTDDGHLVADHDTPGALGGSEVTETPNVTPGGTQRQDEPPKRGRGPGKSKIRPGKLVWVCETCHRVIVGSGAGYACVSLVDAQKTAQRAVAGYHDPAKARWHIAHKACLPQAIAPMSGWFVVWTTEVTTVDDLLDAVVTLSRGDWFVHTDWQGFVRQVRADTENAAMRIAARADVDTAAYAARMRERALQALVDDPDDERHGSTTGYTYGCRCVRCRAVNAHDSRERYTKRLRQQRAAAESKRMLRADVKYIAPTTGALSDDDRTKAIERRKRRLERDC